MAEFDTAKGAFLLVAMIIATMMVIILIGMLSCSYLAISGVPSPVCGPELKEFAKEIITMAFTAAIAFAGGRLSAPVVPPPKLPDKDK